MMKYSGKRFILALIFLLLGAHILMAGTTVSDTDKYSWGPDIGWLNWQGDKTQGVVFDNTDYLSGYIFSANCGWIHLGDGSPANSTAYANDSADDYGVNISSEDPSYYYLEGYAWAPNIGWINFIQEEDSKQNRGAFIPTYACILKSTGVMQGNVWSPNCGWLKLNSSPQALVDLTGQAIPVITGWMLR